MTMFNIWGLKVKWYQLIHSLWARQNRFVRDVLCFKYVTWVPWGNPEDIKPNTRATLGSRFFLIGGKSRKSVRAVYRAPEIILNMGRSGQKLLRTTTKNHSRPPKSFRTLGVGESFLYARQTILINQLSYYRLGGRRVLRTRRGLRDYRYIVVLYARDVDILRSRGIIYKFLNACYDIRRVARLRYLAARRAWCIYSTPVISFHSLSTW